MGPRMEQVKNGTLFYCLHLFEWYDDLTELIRQYAICGFAKFANSKEGPMAILKAVVKGYNDRLEPHSLDICLMPLRSIEPVFHFDGTPVGVYWQDAILSSYRKRASTIHPQQPKGDKEFIPPNPQVS